MRSWGARRGPRDHHAPIRVAHQDDLVQILPLDQPGDVLDVRAESDFRGCKVVTVGHAGKARRDDAMPFKLEQLSHRLPLPSAGPGSVHEEEHAHSAAPFPTSSSERTSSSVEGRRGARVAEVRDPRSNG